MDKDSWAKRNSRLISRRKFLENSATLAGGTLLSPLSLRRSFSAGITDTLTIALIGSGARGTGAALNALEADGGARLVAIADVFRDKVDKSHDILKKNEAINKQVDVPEARKFVGLDAYEKAIHLTEVDIVILATPPAFRPLHFETAVNNGKHVFMEKPLSTDAPGARRIFAAGKQAEQHGLSVVVGLQYRYALLFQKLVDKLHNGIIGEITSITCNYLLAGIKQVIREEEQSELQYQLRNWRFFEWLWGGSPAGLTIHFEDIAHWVKDSYPIRAFGTGGRMALKGPEHGNIYDHYYIEYEYADGTRLHSRTRHMQGCWTNRTLLFQGSEGIAKVSGGTEIEINDFKGESLWKYKDTDDPNPYQVEHEMLFKAIRSGEPINDTDWAGRSSMTSIMGRMAVQSGKLVEWDQALNSDVVMVPENLTFESDPPVHPEKNGNYWVPVPGSDINIV